MSDGQGRILIVDDEPQIGMLILDELSACGWECMVATDSQQASDMLDVGNFDVMIADISMPGLSGLELLAHAKVHAPNCRVVLMTGLGDEQVLSRAIFLGAFDYITKPFSPGGLVDVVSRAMSAKAMESELTGRAAEAIQNGASVRQAPLDIVWAFARAVEAKDPFTRRHSEQVAYYAGAMARILNFPAALQETIRVASLLHDVGMIGVPDRILTKTEPLTEDEFVFVRRHPALGADIVSGIGMFKDEAQLIRHHHERWDGEGYPDGLGGEESPVGSRVMQVADGMDAMLMDRVYRRSYPIERMLEELTRCAGTQFDPRIAAAAVQWAKNSPDKLILPDRAALLV